MHHARSFLTVLFLVGSLAGATRAIAAEDTSPPSVTSHEVNVLRQVAIALAAGDHAIQDLRGPPIENSNLDRLKLPTPGMDCGIARSLIFVVCRSASLNKKKKPRLCSLESLIMGKLPCRPIAGDNLKPYLTPV